MSCRLRAVFVAVMCVCCVALSRAQVNADQVLNIGRNALYFEDYMVAIQYFNQAISAKPYLAKPYFFRAIAKLNLDDFYGAEEDASKAIELNRFITDAYEVRGVARQNTGNYRGAIEDYREALELLPRNRQLLFNVAMAQTAIKDYAAADSTYNKLLGWYPGFENGYLGRARLRLETGDTIAAIVDIDSALVRNPDSFNGHVMRAELFMRGRRPSFKHALADMDKAIKLEPRAAGLYVNRAYIRYNLDDWYGAMEDYDHALNLEPLNIAAMFNRGLLNAEVDANDRALDDFSGVLALDPSDHRAYYNRALVRAKKHDYDGAIADIGEVIKVFPDFPAGYLIRSDFYRAKGDVNHAVADSDTARRLTKKLKPVNGRVDSGIAEDSTQPDPSELTKREFASLLTVDDNTDMRQEYNNTAIRGRVQDRNTNIEAEPMVELAYYTSPDELNANAYYIKEVDDLNATRQLRFVVFVTIAPPVLRDDDVIQRHFNSIDYYNSYLATHAPRAVDYIGRAMDFITVRDYVSAISDLDRAIALTPDFAPAYMMRAQARKNMHDAGRSIVADESQRDSHADGAALAGMERKTLDDIVADLDRVVSLTPLNAFAWYNRGVALIDAGNIAEAEKSFTRTIELKPDFGPAYYNRGYVRLKTGRRTDGVNDLSRAGELGVASAYNLIKRISR